MATSRNNFWLVQKKNRWYTYTAHWARIKITGVLQQAGGTQNTISSDSNLSSLSLDQGSSYHAVRLVVGQVVLLQNGVVGLDFAGIFRDSPGTCHQKMIVVLDVVENLARRPVQLPVAFFVFLL